MRPTGRSPHPITRLDATERSRVASTYWRHKEAGPIRGTENIKLKGKIALITGGSCGIGLATARQFIDQGAFGYITGRREAELSATVDRIGRNISAVQGDVSNLKDLDRLFEQIKQEKGTLDVIFANAGIAKFAKFGSITEQFYDSIFDINVKGVLFTVQKALPLLKVGASVILCSSVVGSKGLPMNSVYAATKAALRSFARTWTTDLKQRHPCERDQPRLDRHARTE
jgi:NAD(P)-dependent dehydrogenase (short-subunit alcohol dehydrogenase family)